jgi:hypothetical protein
MPRELVTMKNAGRSDSNSDRIVSNDQSVRTATPYIVCVPVGSSSTTAIFSPLDAILSRIQGRGLSGHSGGRSRRVSTKDMRDVIDRHDSDACGMGAIVTANLVNVKLDIA